MRFRGGAFDLETDLGIEYGYICASLLVVCVEQKRDDEKLGNTEFRLQNARKKKKILNNMRKFSFPGCPIRRVKDGWGRNRGLL